MQTCKSVLQEVLSLRRFRDDRRGAVSVEMLLIMPLLIWAYLGMMVFYDGYRARMEAQTAALHIADLISRHDEAIEIAYLEGLNNVYDFLTSRNRETRLRISSVMLDPDTQRPVVVWSYGTRGLSSLPQMAYLDALTVSGPEEPSEGGSRFEIASNQAPVADLAQRIPNVLPGEALILVEAFTIWDSPLRTSLDPLDLTGIRMAPIAVTRPRFSPFIRFAEDNEVFPDSPVETEPETGAPELGDLDMPDDPANPDTVVTVVDTDFTDGNTSNWSQDTLSHTSSFSFLGPFGRETVQNPVTYQVNLGRDSRRAAIEFDLFIIDSWDAYTRPWSPPSGDMLIITVNGTAISATPFMSGPWGTFERDRRHVVSREEGVFTTTMTLVDSHSNLWGAGWSDQIWRVRIEVENPASQFTLGFIGDLSGDINNESFGFMSFNVTAEPGSHSQPPHFRPMSARVSDDPATRFAVHEGCPDHRIGTKTLALRVDDLWSGLRFQVQARGEERLRQCDVGLANINQNNPFRSHATPNLVLDWDNLGYNWQGSFLRILADDGNFGRTCDTTLLIRTPSGQWLFNDDFRGWDAGRELGPAQSGQYHIWIGRYGGGTCVSDLVFELY